MRGKESPRSYLRNDHHRLEVSIRTMITLGVNAGLRH